MLPEPGELEELLRLEARVRAKIRAASIYGMEVEVLEGVEAELRAFADRLAAGDPGLLDEDGDADPSGAFLGEELRARVLRAKLEGELARIEVLPWGVGAVLRRARPGRPGVFFATRTRPMPGAERGHRYRRYVELEPGEGASGLVDSDLEILRRIDPEAGTPGEIEGVDLEAAWRRACEGIAAEHNRRTDPRTAQEAIGPAQRFALELLRDPAVVLPEGAERAEAALSVERSSAVRRALNELWAAAREGGISRKEAAARIVELAEQLGLQPVGWTNSRSPSARTTSVSSAGWRCWRRRRSRRRLAPAALACRSPTSTCAARAGPRSGAWRRRRTRCARRARRRERRLLQLLAHRLRLERLDPVRADEAAGLDEAGQLVAGEQGPLQRGVARDREVLGVGEDRLDHLLRPALLAQDRRAVLRVAVERRVDLVIEIVQERGRAPQLLVLPEAGGVGADARLDPERVAEQRLALRVRRQRLPGTVSGRSHRVG